MFAIISGRKLIIFRFLLVPINTHQYPHSIPTFTEILSLQSFLAEEWKFSVFFLDPINTHQYPHIIPTFTEIVSLQSFLAEKLKFSVFF